MPDRLLYFVVGDRGLDAGNGLFVLTLEAMRDRLVREQRQHDWTLVISIHGAQNCVATRGGYLESCNAAGAYNANAIQRVFDRNTAFVEWRRRFGPRRVVLNACQVNIPFERVILNALLRPGTTQRPQGLGQGCRPGTEVMYLEYNNRLIRTRSQWNRISRADRRSLQEQLRQLNRQFGYFGAPTVSDGLVLQYCFDEEPLGGWPVVRVTHLRRDATIPFYNRTQHPQFLRQCREHIAPLPGRGPSIPPPVRR